MWVFSYFIGLAKEDKRPIEEIIREKILQVLESAYPNVLEVEDLVRYGAIEEQFAQCWQVNFVWLKWPVAIGLCLSQFMLHCAMNFLKFILSWHRTEKYSANRI